jgi:hypothetical protein
MPFSLLLLVLGFRQNDISTQVLRLTNPLVSSQIDEACGTKLSYRAIRQIAQESAMCNPPASFVL